ncbi:MAG TPA: metal-dependent hydrolase [Candidatus Thermoplasmatota archaeon]|nr:metal-dependent hydrolase [Candidatus Thermoplasmatota archaeon]
MSSLVIHLLIPPLVALATRRFPLKLVLLLLPFSLLPDIDFFVPPHRALFHSVFLVAIFGAYAWRAGELGKPSHRDAALLAAFYLGSHSLMDLFVGGVVPLWPLSDQTFYIDVQILIDTRTLQPFPTFEPGTQQGVPEVTPLYEFLDGVQFGILVLTLLVAGAAAVRRMRHVKREVVVVAPDAPRR